MTDYRCNGCKDHHCIVGVREGRGNHSPPPDVVMDKRCLYSVNEHNRKVEWEYPT